MRRVVLTSIAALLAFAVILLVRFPAHWAAGALPANVACSGISGTLWRGSCALLLVENVPAGRLEWQLRPARLLAGKLAAHATLTRDSARIDAEVELGAGRHITARNLAALLPLDPSIVPGVPGELRGTLRADLPLLRLQQRIVRDVQGRIEVRDLVQHGSNPLPLGSYVVTFPPEAAAGGEPLGRLEDAGGPLAVTGTLRLTAEPGWVLEGTVAARPEAREALANQLRFLGAADAAGRRVFSLAGTY